MLILNKEVKREEFLECFLGRTQKEAEEVHKEFSYLLNAIARNYSLGTGLDKSDLFGESLVGLARAKRDFDKGRSDDFKTFAIYKIKDCLNKFIRENMRSVIIPAYVKGANSLINRLRNLLEFHGLPDEEVDKIISEGVVDNIDLDCEAMEEITKLVDYLRSSAKRANTTYEKLINRANFLPNDQQFDDFCVSEEDRTIEKVLISQIWEIMDDTDKKIGSMIMKGETKKDIGAYFGRSITWVNNRLKKLRKKII